MAKKNISPLEQFKADDLLPYANNSRTHDDAQVQQIMDSIQYFGFTNPVIVDEKGLIIAGHGRVIAAGNLYKNGAKLHCADGTPLEPGHVPVIRAVGWTDAQKRAYVIADNKLALNAGWDLVKLNLELSALDAAGFDRALTGFSAKEIDGINASACNGIGSDKTAAEKPFVLPPVSVFDTTKRDWIKRRDWWLAFGLLPDGETGVVFDPALAEIVTRWFCPKKGIVIDPYAGSAVRGIVASSLGMEYIGVTGSADEVEANLDQATTLCNDPLPIWRAGEARNIGRMCKGVKADFLFTEIPAGTLDFALAIIPATTMLKANRFACAVVGRHADVYEIQRGFREVDLQFHTEIAVIQAEGETSRHEGDFNAARTIGQRHFRVLVFVKGDAEKAAAACGEIQFVDEPDEENDE